MALGLIAQHESLTAAELAAVLNLKEVADAHHWLGRLADWEIVESRGRTRGTEYYIVPGMLRHLEFKGATTLKGIEQHRLQELILRDLEIYRVSDLDGIHHRIGKEIPRRKVLYQIQKLLADKKIEKEGAGRWTKYVYKQNASE
ncbi:MAG: hypothetical protein ACREEM_06700 [Blastocatellia bacterium]